jgi:rhomboid protease GluP
MFKRQTTGSVVCASCGTLVGVNDDRCYSCGRRNPGLWGFGPVLRRLGNDLGFVPLVVYVCIGLYFAMLVMTLVLGGDIMGGGNFLSILSPHLNVTRIFGASGGVPVFVEGKWWTLLSASWLHGSALHILFNMMWVRQLGPATADIYGAARMVIIYTVAGVLGFFLSSLAGALLPPLLIIGGAPFTLGASAAIFGLLGSLVYYGRRSGSSIVRTEALGYAIPLFMFGLFIPGIDNYAHAGGFAGGYLAGMWLDPLKPERMDHFFGAAFCIFASWIAIAASIVAVFWPF